jgi:predicted dehydrogenase
MAPIRIAFIGLSKVGWAPNAHLPYILASPDYEIVAICNSSIESSKEAIKLYKLAASVKAYGDPEGLFLLSSKLSSGFGSLADIWVAWAK